MKPKDNEPGTISVLIAKVSPPTPNKSGATRWIPKLGRQAPRTGIDIPSYEYLARGWDATNDKWREVLWAALDQDFRAAELEGTSPIWKLKWNRAQETETTAGRGNGRAKEANDWASESIGPAHEATKEPGRGGGRAQEDQKRAKKGMGKEPVKAG